MLSLAALLWSSLSPAPLGAPLGAPLAATPPTQEVFVDLDRAYPNLRFDRPVFLTGAGDDSGRVFVVEQAGIIRVFDGTADESELSQAETFLDISERVSRRGNEQGLLGLAFHPDFATNGQFFVHYSFAERGEGRGAEPNILARFHVSADDPNRADADSEEVLLNQRQPFSNHNGGMIAFGPDGYLYGSLGDGGAANDPEGNGQKLSSLLGSIFRIDVDSESGDNAFGIPADNPFLEVEGARPELFAIGLRNVWRFSFDRETGALYAADVGQNEIEEVNLITAGGNYGWRRFEASSTFDGKTPLIHGEHTPPIAEYERAEGISITGGYVYRGEDHPDLQGSYFYGDYASGNLWRLVPDGTGYRTELVRRTGRSLASFGEDDRGELYGLSFDGGLYRIVATEAPPATFDDWPALLSETGYYASLEDRSLPADAIPYEVNAAFWSDSATKERYLILPEDAQLGYSPDGPWDVPAGTAILKTFEGQHVDSRRVLETRVIRRTADAWQAATYVWNRAQTEAELLPSGRQFELYSRQTGVSSWHAPSASECTSCHTDAAGFALGLRTAQLNRSIDGVHQIEALVTSGRLAQAADFRTASAPAFVDPSDPTADLELRARTYLDVNCAMCHQPTGPGNASIDLRFTTPLADTGLLEVPPTQGDLGLPDARLIVPGFPERSVLLERITTLGSGRMPPIGSNVVDAQAAELLAEWISSLAD